LSAPRPTTSVPPPPRQQLGRMILFTALAMLALIVLSIVLTLPGNVGPENFLGFGSDRSGQDELQATVRAWHRLSRAGSLSLREGHRFR
jgi:hypothetical protein